MATPIQDSAYVSAIPALRLTLLVADLAMLDAAIESPDALSRALGGAAIAEGWEVFTEALPGTRDALAADPSSSRWGTRLFLLDGHPPTLGGWGGFKGPPSDGVVELGYSVAPALRNRGVASEAVVAMLEEAFADDEVEAVIAHTLAEPNASARVLERAGFTHDGEMIDPHEGSIRHWRRNRRPGAPARGSATSL